MTVLTHAMRSRTWKIGIAVVGAAAVFALFWAQRESGAPEPAEHHDEIAPELASSLDREVDSVLARCNIEQGWIRKSSVPGPSSRTSLTERRVVIPPDVLPVHVNVAMNVMAKRYRAKVIAYENVKDNSVALHIEYNGTLIQKIILKTNPSLQRRAHRHDSPKA